MTYNMIVMWIDDLMIAYVVHIYILFNPPAELLVSTRPLKPSTVGFKDNQLASRVFRWLNQVVIMLVEQIGWLIVGQRIPGPKKGNTSCILSSQTWAKESSRLRPVINIIFSSESIIQATEEAEGEYVCAFIDCVVFILAYMYTCIHTTNLHKYTSVDAICTFLLKLAEWVHKNALQVISERLEEFCFLCVWYAPFPIPVSSSSQCDCNYPCQWTTVLSWLAPLRWFPWVQVCQPDPNSPS